MNGCETKKSEICEENIVSVSAFKRLDAAQKRKGSDIQRKVLVTHIAPTAHRNATVSTFADSPPSIDTIGFSATQGGIWTCGLGEYSDQGGH